jgi:hypothetical protein
MTYQSLTQYLTKGEVAEESSRMNIITIVESHQRKIATIGKDSRWKYLEFLTQRKIRLDIGGSAVPVINQFREQSLHLDYGDDLSLATIQGGSAPRAR